MQKASIRSRCLVRTGVLTACNYNLLTLQNIAAEAYKLELKILRLRGWEMKTLTWIEGEAFAKKELPGL